MTFDESTHGAMWLYQQGDLVLGPVPGQQIIDKLYSGELEPATPVQALGAGAFAPLSEVAEFRLHVAKAEARRRVEAHAAEHHATQRSRLVRWAVAAGVGLAAVGVGVVLLGQYLAVHGGPTVGELAAGEITIDPPTITRARRAADEELVDYRAAAKRPPPRPEGGARPEPAGRGQASAPAPAAPADPDGLAVAEVDAAGINAVVAKYKPTLIPCIQAVAKAEAPATRIPIEFTVTEAGHVTTVWVDNEAFKATPLKDCLLKELGKWPFKPGPSAATVNLSFNVGKRG